MGKQLPSEPKNVKAPVLTRSPFNPKKFKKISNLIKRVMEEVKKDIMKGVYNELLILAFWTGLTIDEFNAWLSSLKYGFAKVCKDVWRHQKFDLNLGQEHNYKVALTKITKVFLERKSLADMGFKKDCQFNLHYKLIRDLILLAMESDHPESINFRRLFL